MNLGADFFDPFIMPQRSRAGQVSALTAPLLQLTRSTHSRKLQKVGAHETPIARDIGRVASKRQAIADAYSSKGRDCTELHALRREFKKARKATVKMLEKIERDIAAGSQRDARCKAKRFLRSYSAKLMALEAANNKLRKSQKVSGERLIEEAKRLDLFTVEEEMVRLHSIAKNSDPLSRRIIHSFGLRHRARQYLCKAVLEPFLLPICQEYQYGIANKHREDAIKELANAIKCGELRYFIEMDVSDFFPSIAVGFSPDLETARQELENFLPIPVEIITNSILTSNNRLDTSFLPAIDVISQSMDSRRGLPQGSAVSPIIASAIMSQLLEEAKGGLSAGVFFISYVDNVGIYGAQASKVERAAKTLERVLARCRFGSLRLRRVRDLKSANEGFKYLGYSIRHRERRGKPFAEIGVSAENKLKFQDEIRERFKRTKVSSFFPIDLRKAREGSLRQYFIGWCRSFSAVPNIRKKAVALAAAAIEHADERWMLERLLQE